MDQFFELVDEKTIRRWKAVDTISLDDVIADVENINSLLSLPNEAKEIIIRDHRHIRSLYDFVGKMNKDLGIKMTLQKFWDMATERISFDALIGGWMSPIEVMNSCGEIVGNEAVNAIDGDPNTFWSHTEIGRHWITVSLGSFFVITHIRFWLNVGDEDAYKLNDVNVSIGHSPDAVDKIVLHKLIVGKDGWNEFVFPEPIECRYIKLGNMISNDVKGVLNLRGFEVYYSTVKGGKPSTTTSVGG